MIKGIKVMLIPNNIQEVKLFQYAGAKRFAFNWALARQQENYKNGGKFINDGDLRKEFTKLKQQEEYKWVNSISNNVTKQAIKDCCIAFNRFFKDQSKYPKFKSKKKSPPKFYQPNDKIQFTETHVKLEGFATSKKKNKQRINWIRLAEHNRIPYGKDIKYINPRVSYDGLHWWISVGIECKQTLKLPTNQGIGIDLGIKDLAICSDNHTYKNINKSKESKRLKKKQRRLQRKVSKKYLINKKGDSYRKTYNIVKLEKLLLRVSRRLTNIRHNYLHQTTTDIINRKPMFITIEDLNVGGMMKNKHLSKAVQEQCFYEFKRQLEYKTLWSNIELRIASRWYPSSKTCHDCGYVKKDLNLSDREWMCPECGVIHDRDYNASLNLKDCTDYQIYKPA